MANFNKYSHKKQFTYDSSKNEFIELKQYAITHPEVKKLTVRGMFTYEGKKGTRAAIVIEGYNINLPSHMVDDVRAILKNEDGEINDINAGHCGFEIDTYEDNKYGNGICYTGNFYQID